MSRFSAYDEDTAAAATPSAAWAPDDEESSSFEPVTPLCGYDNVAYVTCFANLIATFHKCTAYILIEVVILLTPPEVVLNECVPYFLLQGVRPEVDGKLGRRRWQRATDREIILPENQIQYWVEESLILSGSFRLFLPSLSRGHSFRDYLILIILIVEVVVLGLLVLRHVNDEYVLQYRPVQHSSFVILSINFQRDILSQSDTFGAGKIELVLGLRPLRV